MRWLSNVPPDNDDGAFFALAATVEILANHLAFHPSAKVPPTVIAHPHIMVDGNRRLDRREDGVKLFQRVWLGVICAKVDIRFSCPLQGGLVPRSHISGHALHPRQRPLERGDLYVFLVGHASPFQRS